MLPFCTCAYCMFCCIQPATLVILFTLSVVSFSCDVGCIINSDCALVIHPHYVYAETSQVLHIS